MTSQPDLILPMDAAGALRRPPHGLLDRPEALLWLVIILGAAMRLLLAGLVSYGYGEGYYIATARYFDLSYFDQPPLSLWAAWAMMKLTGTSDPLVVRLPWIIMFAVATWAIYRLTTELYSKRAGAYAALFLNVSPVFAYSIGGWVQPDGPLVMFLLLAATPMARILLGTSASVNRDWLLAGLFFGLALFSKYHAMLTLAGVLFFVLSMPEARKRFFVPQLFGAGVIVALIGIPVIIWNLQHNWASLAFQGGRITEFAGIHPEWFIRSIFGQAFLIGLLLWPFVIHAWWHALKEGRANPAHWLLSCMAFLPVAIFTIAAIWAPFEYHFHWQSPGYLFLFPILADRLARQREDGLTWPRTIITIMVAGFVALTALILAQGATGFIGRIMPASITRNVPEAANPLKELVAWQGVREALEENGLLNRTNTFATADRWYLTGKVDTQVDGDLPVVCLCHDPRNQAFLVEHRAMKGWDGVAIFDTRYPDALKNVMARRFETFEKVTDVDVRFRGLPETRVEIWLGRNYDGAYKMPTDELIPFEAQ